MSKSRAIERETDSEASERSLLMALCLFGVMAPFFSSYSYSLLESCAYHVMERRPCQKLARVLSNGGQ